MGFCDLKCAFAEPARSDMDGSRSCMTFTALYCTLHNRHVMKAQRCEERVERKADRSSKNEVRRKRP